MPYICDICGREMFKKIRAHGVTYCNKHYNQVKKYGCILDNNPRTSRDKNELHINGNTTFVDLYDKNYNVVAQAIIDTEDIDKIKYTKWKLSRSGYAMNISDFCTACQCHGITPVFMV